MAIRIERSDMVATIVLDRPAARALVGAFEEFERFAAGAGRHGQF